MMSQQAPTVENQDETRTSHSGSGLAEANVMLDLFEGFGVHSFSLTLLDEAGCKVAFKPRRTANTLRVQMPGLLLAAIQQRLNVIIRPLAAEATSLVQLDDLSPSTLDRVRAFSFLVLETSHQSFQAWLALKVANATETRRIKRAAGADPSASGATRIAGSYNFKPKYAPDYPRVRLQSIAPHRTVTIAELDDVGLTGTVEPSLYSPRHAPHRKPNLHLLKWPSYERCLLDAPGAKNHDGPDRSAADFEFCLISIDRGWPVETVANQLMLRSEKARSLGKNYALFTAERAELIVNRDRR